MADKTACTCGSRDFIAPRISLTILNVPASVNAEGRLTYDDTKGESEGWDTTNEPTIKCVKCGKLYGIVRNNDDQDTVHIETREL